MSTAFDERMMRRALALSRRGEGRVEPNPMVGCVIVKGGRVIAEGYHRRFGGAHAEVEALSRCTESPRGATVYVTLEPCSHFGKTPPCADALVKAGVRRVVIATGDPNPLVGGKGIRRLRAAGVHAEMGVLRAEAEEVLAPFLTWMVQRRPYVIAKWAQSLDGKLVTPRGESKWISGDASRREVHRLRARVDAILVGSGTVRADDPKLTAREVAVRRVAKRVVLDGRMRIGERSNLVLTARDVPTIVLTSEMAGRGRKAERLREAGVEVLGVASKRGRLDLRRVLRELWRRDVANLLVEGGPTVLGAFFEAGLVDEAWVFTAPKFIGGRAGSAGSGRLGSSFLFRSKVPSNVTVRRVGEDVLHRMRFAGAAVGRRKI